jgi:flagellar hook-basal body complex protein FliE
VTVRVGGIDESAPLRPAAESLGELPPGTGPSDGVSFGDILGETIEQANRADRVAATKTDALAAGVSDDLHGTMIAVKEADISIKLVGTIRNKVLDAFQEIWKTSV